MNPEEMRGKQNKWKVWGLFAIIKVLLRPELQLECSVWSMNLEIDEVKKDKHNAKNDSAR